MQKELKKHLTYQEHRHGRIGIHDPIFYEYGPSNYECALREIERLREALQTIAEEGSGWGQSVALAALKGSE